MTCNLACIDTQTGRVRVYRRNIMLGKPPKRLGEAIIPQWRDFMNKLASLDMSSIDEFRRYPEKYASA